jgi:UDP-2,4-diacetamido-2,4,6-trideoxy-beta-L-altropyranose hydrolase
MSSRKKILIRADNSASIGLGHLMRTLLLAEGLQNDFEIVYAARELTGSKNALILQKGFDLHILQTMQCKEFTGLIQKLQPVLCIVDHYDIDRACEKSIREHCSLLVFDDEFKAHDADIVLNHSFIAKTDDYAYLKQTQILAGSAYTLLKDTFFKPIEPCVPLDTLTNKKVLITLGGTDVLFLSLPLKEQLLHLEKTLQIDIVTTSANPQLALLKKKEKNLIVDAQDMAALMCSYDLIVTSASTSLLETVALKKPFIAIQCATNQAKTVDILKRQGLQNVIAEYTPSSLKTALLYVQNHGDALCRAMQRYGFQKYGAAKEIIDAYS